MWKINRAGSSKASGQLIEVILKNRQEFLDPLAAMQLLD
jgi:hypothetical protein